MPCTVLTILAKSASVYKSLEYARVWGDCWTAFPDWGVGGGIFFWGGGGETAMSLPRPALSLHSADGHG
jgi:hypothetical protein